MAAPKKWTDEKRAAASKEICRRVAGGENVDVITRDKDMPHRDTVYSWLREFPEFADEYARAREARADARSDRIDDWVKKAVDGEIDHQVARLAIDAEKWQAGKENPKRYGDKVTNELVGEDGGPVQIAHFDMDKLLDGKPRWRDKRKEE